MRADGAPTVGTRAATAADFLATLRGEQARFVEALRVAQASLPQHDGQLARLAALQLRLTFQFLDAQRSILTHRAQVDEQVERILIQAGLPNADVDGADELRHPGSQLDSSSAPRQLTSMLDDWWCAETLDGKAAIDAAVQAAESHDDVVRPGPLETDLLPAAAQVVLTELSAIEDLQAFLDALAASLEPAEALELPAPMDSLDANPGEALIRLDGPAADEQFGRFWKPEAVTSGEAASALPEGRRATRRTERRVSLAWNR